MNFQFGYLAVMLLTLSILMFTGYAHWAEDPGIWEIEGEHSTGQGNLDNGFWVSHTFYDTIPNSTNTSDGSAWATLKKKALGGGIHKSVGSSSCAVWAPKNTSLGVSKGEYTVKSVTQPGWFGKPKVDRKSSKYNGDIYRSTYKSSTHWGMSQFSHVTCDGSAKITNRTGEAYSAGEWGGDPH